MQVPRKEFPNLEIAHLRKLEFRALAFISLRALVRCELVLASLHDRMLPVDHQKLFDELKQLLIEVVKAPPSVTKASEVLPWNLLATYKEKVEILPISSHERICFLGAVDACRVAPGKVSQVIGWSEYMGSGLQPKKLQEQFQCELAWAAYDDLKRVEAIAAKGGFEKNVDLATDPLSEIWPESEPDWKFYKSHLDASSG